MGWRGSCAESVLEEMKDPWDDLFPKGLIEYGKAGVGGESSGERWYRESRLYPLPITVART